MAAQPQDDFDSIYKRSIAGLASAAPATAGVTTRSINPATDTAAGQLDKVLAKDGSLMQRARAQGQDWANSRGLLNSSVAAEASQGAMIDRATPIATTDAGFYNEAARDNMQAQNTASMFNAGEANKFSLTGLSEAGANYRLGQGQNFTAGENEKDRAARATEFGQTIGLQRDQLNAQIDQFAQRLGVDVQDLQLRRDQLSQQDRQFLDDLNQRNQQLAQQESQFQRQQTQQTALAQMDAASRERLAQIEFQSREAIQGSQNISQAWGTMMDTISRIQTNPDLDAATKTALINNNIESFRSFTNFWSKSSGAADVSDLLNFSVAPTEKPPESTTTPVGSNNPNRGDVTSDGP